jgi:hypothetical protein
MSISTSAAVISNRPNRLLRTLGARWKDRRTVTFHWGEWSRRFGISIELINWGEDRDWSLKLLPLYGTFYIKLPFMPKRECKDVMDSWGFSWNWDSDNRGADIHLNWAHRCKILHLPWDYVHVRHDMLCEDGEWRKYIGSWQRKEGDPLPATEVYPYRYVCRDGAIQDDITATIHVDEMEWRWKLARSLRLPWPRKIRRTISVDFSKEVGERRGSWKGGCTGCSYEMRPDETPQECLFRMQRDRRFL